MKTTTKLLSVLLAAALLTGAYFLGTIQGVPAASAIDISGLDSRGLAAALSTAAFTTKASTGDPKFGKVAAEFYNNFMVSAK